MGGGPICTDFDVVLQLQEVVEGTEVRGFAVQNGEVDFLVVGGNRCQGPHIGSVGDQDLGKPPATPAAPPHQPTQPPTNLINFRAISIARHCHQ